MLTVSFCSVGMLVELQEPDITELFYFKNIYKKQNQKIILKTVKCVCLAILTIAFILILDNKLLQCSFSLSCMTHFITKSCV